MTVEKKSRPETEFNYDCQGPSTFETYTLGDCIRRSSGYVQFSLATSVPVPTGTPTQMPVVLTTPFAPGSSPTVKPVAPGSPTQMPVVLTTPFAPGSPTVMPVPADVTSSSKSNDKSDSKACFAGTETVALESGEIKSISGVVVGDRVLAADARRQPLFAEFIFVPHGANEEEAFFTHITTALGRDIKLTASHILPAGDCDSQSPLPHVYASEVTVGSCILTVSGVEKVSAVGAVPGLGLYTIITKEQYVVVNGIIASPFAFSHVLGNCYYNIHRLVHAFFPSTLRSPLLHSINEVGV